MMQSPERGNGIDQADNENLNWPAEEVQVASTGVGAGVTHACRKLTMLRSVLKPVTLAHRRFGSRQTRCDELPTESASLP